MSFKESAIQRVIKAMDSYDYDRPADLLADLIHFCDSQQGVERGSDTFDEELRVAYSYVEDELGLDAEVADREDSE